MDDKKLEEIWNGIMQEAFDKFIEENVGSGTDGIKPACFGSGDARDWCRYCAFKPTC
ncbi:hypothetical protein JW948_15730 [bacterium]|nr:hypothetical protein [bacterium]